MESKRLNKKIYENKRWEGREEERQTKNETEEQEQRNQCDTEDRNEVEGVGVPAKIIVLEGCLEYAERYGFLTTERQTDGCIIKTVSDSFKSILQAELFIGKLLLIFTIFV